MMKWKAISVVVITLLLTLSYLHYTDKVPGLSSIVNIRIADDAVRQDEEHVEQKKPHVHGDVEKQDLDIGPTVTISITTFPVTSPTPSSDKNTNNHTSQANTYYHSNQTQWQAQQNKGCTNASVGQGLRYLSFTRVNKEFHFMYCGIPKVGSSNWKRVLIALSYPTQMRHSFTFQDLNNFVSVHNSKRVKTLINMRNLDKNSFYRFTLFRHPYTRLVSAWRNKFGKDPGQSINKFYYKKIGFKVILKLRGEDALKNFNESNPEDLLTFKEFVAGIKMGYNDRHWLPQVQLCQPCLVNYDYVGFFEYINDEQKYLYKYLGFEDEIPIPTKIASHSKVRSTTDVTRELFEKLSRGEKDFLYSFYKDDFSLLGYSPNTTSPRFPYPPVDKISVINVQPRHN